jgi:hypothetical protein
MGAQTIVVTFAGGHLSIDPEVLHVGDGDWAVWRFMDLPAHCLPYVRFGSGFGPFHSLRTYDEAMHIVSKGHVAKSEHATENYHAYTVMILPPDKDSPVASQAAMIVNEVTAGDPLPDVQVTFNPGDSSIDVSPDRIRINEGDIVNWRVTGLPAGAFVTFQFLDEEGAPARLFKSFSLLPGEGSDVQASAMGFLAGAGAAPSSFSYQIRVRDQDGNLLGGHDPAIDNIGPPIPTGDDGG